MVFTLKISVKKKKAHHYSRSLHSFHDPIKGLDLLNMFGYSPMDYWICQQDTADSRDYMSVAQKLFYKDESVLIEYVPKRKRKKILNPLISF